MGSKNYLNVTISPRSTLSENKQKSCESYDSTSSNYSQFSEKSDTSITNPEIENISKSASVFSSSDFTHFDFSTNEAQVKRSLWQKTVASFRGHKDKKSSFLRHKSVASPSRSPRVSECQEMDPVYHLLKCAAGYNKCQKSVDGVKSESPVHSCYERQKSLHGVHLNMSKGGCTDPTCPCNQPDKLPVVKKEDLGQQAKRELSIKKSISVSPRQSTMNSRSRSVTTAFTKY